jgi:hypothetical protein
MPHALPRAKRIRKLGRLEELHQRAYARLLSPCFHENDQFFDEWHPREPTWAPDISVSAQYDLVDHIRLLHGQAQDQTK